MTFSHLLESCFRLSSSGTDTLLISKSRVFTSSLNSFLDLFFWIWLIGLGIFFPIAAQHPFIPRFLLLFPLNFLCGPRCSCALISLFCLQHFAFLLAQFHVEDFRALFLAITIILNHKPAFQCLSSSSNLALFRHLLAAFPSPSSILPHSGQT